MLLYHERIWLDCDSPGGGEFRLLTKGRYTTLYYCCLIVHFVLHLQYPEAEGLMRPGKHKGTHLALEEAIKRNALLEEKGSSLPKTICRICFYGEDEGTKKAPRMLSCKSCNKKYHRSCLKRWSENRSTISYM